MSLSYWHASVYNDLQKYSGANIIVIENHIVFQSSAILLNNSQIWLLLRFFYLDSLILSFLFKR